MVSLLTFIQTGRLGEIGLDSTRDEVELAFGPPGSWGWLSKGNWLSRPKWQSSIYKWKRRVPPSEATTWVYGGFSFTFQGEKVNSVNIFFPNQLDCGGLSEASTPEEVKRHLSEEGIVFEGELPDSPYGFYLYVNASAVQLNFPFDPHPPLLVSLTV